MGGKSTDDEGGGYGGGGVRGGDENKMTEEARPVSLAIAMADPEPTITIAVAFRVRKSQQLGRQGFPKPSNFTLSLSSTLPMPLQSSQTPPKD